MVPKNVQNAMVSPELQQELSTSHPTPQPITSNCASNSFDIVSPKGKEEWILNGGNLIDQHLSQSFNDTPRELSEYFPERLLIQPMQSSTKALKHSYSKRPWTSEEDQKLAAFVKREGVGKWKQAATLIFGRTGKQCRERWLNNLNPNVRKGNWTPQEDELIIDLYQKYGSKWTQIAKHTPGRTENSIKNRFYCALRNPATVRKRNQIKAMSFENAKLEDTTHEVKTHSEELEGCIVKHEPPVFCSLNAGFSSDSDHQCYQESIHKWAVKEEEEGETEEDETSHHIKEEVIDTKFPINICFNGSKEKQDEIMNLAAKMRHETLVKTESENNKFTFAKFLLPIDCPVHNNFFTKHYDEFKDLQGNLLNKFGALQQRTLGCPDQEILDLNSAFKVTSASGTTQFSRHDIGCKNFLQDQWASQPNLSIDATLQNFHPIQAPTLPANIIQNQQEGLHFGQFQEMMNQFQLQQRQISLDNMKSLNPSLLNLAFAENSKNLNSAFPIEESLLKTLDFSNRTHLQENSANLLPFPVRRREQYPEYFSGVSETNLRSLGFEQLAKFDARKRHEETHANRRADENLNNMMRAIHNKIERVSLIYSHHLKQLNETEASLRYNPREEPQYRALSQQVSSLGKWLVQAKSELQRLEALHQNNMIPDNFMTQERIDAMITNSTNRKRLIDYDSKGTNLDQLIKKRK